MAEYSRIAKGHLTATSGVAQFVNLPFAPDAVEIFNYTAAATPAQYGIPYAYWDVSMGQGYAMYDVFNATPVLTTGAFTSNGISTYQAGLMLQYGAQIGIASITKASAGVVTTVANHNYSTGQVVIFQGLYQSATTGMPQICDIPMQITVTGATTFTIPWNTNQTTYTALSGSPTGAYVKQVLYPWVYSPNEVVISAISTGTTTTISTASPSNVVVGQEVAFRIPAAYGTTQLNSLPNNLIPGSPLYGYVVSVTNALTFVVNINSTGYTAFNLAQSVASVPGLQLPQVVSVGDVNTGGNIISAGSALYPSPQVNGVNTINGPAIRGSFVNNSSAGFIIGANASGASLSGTTSDVIYWRAYLSDYAYN